MDASGRNGGAAVPRLFRLLVPGGEGSETPESRVRALWENPGGHRTFMAIAGAMVWSMGVIVVVLAAIGLAIGGWRY